MNSVCMILLWVVSIERCKLFSIYIRNSFFFLFWNFTFHLSHQKIDYDKLMLPGIVPNPLGNIYTVCISKTLLQCNNRAQWIPYWSCCKKTNWKHLFIILLDHHGVFSGSSKLKKKNPGYGIKERQLLVCLFSWVSIRLYSPIKGLPINS